MSLILGIETSCDETAAAIVRDGTVVESEALSSSSEIHAKTGGVIPEVAARKQVEYIIPVLKSCLEKFSGSVSDLSSLAVTVGPGLIGSLIVGVETAKALSLAWDKPLIPVNHLIGHIYANFIGKNPDDLKFPAVVLIVSGGHTDIILMKGHGDFKYIGGTLDDAGGEAFDKVARLLGLAPFMGGPYVSKKAEEWDKARSSFHFKRPMLDSGDYNFSFSGIKTAVLSKVKSLGTALTEEAKAEISYEFQEAVTDVLCEKTIRAAKEFKAVSILAAGGVSANTVLRSKLAQAAEGLSIPLLVPPLKLCTDNAVYIASCAHFNSTPKSLENISANPSLGVLDF